MEQQMKKQRVTWKRAGEKLLLKCYLAARNDASLKTDKGVKSKGWAKIVARLAKEGISADKDQSKTKYSRLMYDQINAPTLTDENWASLAASQPRNSPLYKRFREEGFEHSELCALIAGDSRANAADATSVTDFLTNETHALLNGPAEDSESDERQDNTQPVGEDQETTGDAENAPPFASPTAAQRTARVKRYRDGRKKNASGASRSREGMEAFFATAERYFQLKADLLAKQLASQDTSQVD
ncbi:hypothetical protein PR001_g32221 [Phytophthora rubi]|uniref:Myb/SANT-like domain-containing protein n=1 Tax=Phytophthora rubi TaxID=129364 RepID=A0A6A3GDH0_9STRA|nr:hypothetical protein PR001_g32221 [Phytophthora rubi]